MLYKKTYYVPGDFDDNRYQPSFSPTLYPGQRIYGFLKLAPESGDCTVLAYVRNATTGEIITGGEIPLTVGMERSLPCHPFPGKRPAG